MNYQQGSIIERYNLNPESPYYKTWHLTIETTTPLLFQPGDSIGILPKNREESIQALLEYFQLSPTQTLPHLQLSAYEWLKTKVEINRVSSRQIAAIAEHAYNVSDRKRLQEPIEMQGYDLLHFLRTHVPNGIALSSISHTFSPLRPRLYSIASSPSWSSTKIDLIIAHVTVDHASYRHFGTCSHYLIHEAPLFLPEIQLFLQSTRHFHFPTHTPTPCIMIGAGTGIAPFRSFMQEIYFSAIPPRPCWLFFGGRQKNEDFYYKPFWSELVARNILSLDLAFSRDQDSKIYVQHKLWNARDQLWNWIMNKAKILVCGKAHTMAKSVDECLVDIIASKKKISTHEAQCWLRQLHREKQYLRDVYS